MPTSAGVYYFAHVAEDAKPNRPPVILIHGAGGNHLSWPPQIRRLAGETIHALDLPGHGQSEGNGRQSIEAYADDVASFMQSRKIRSAVIVGILSQIHSTSNGWSIIHGNGFFQKMVLVISAPK